MEHLQQMIAVLPRHKPESLRVLMVRLHRFIFFDIRWYEIEDATGNQVMTKQGITILTVELRPLDHSGCHWRSPRPGRLPADIVS